VFPGPARDAIRHLAAAQQVTTAREARAAGGWFATPAPVAARLLELADLRPQMTALEPSAGEGAIAGPLAARVQAVDCIEIHAGRAAVLTRAGYARRVMHADFLACRPGCAGAGRDYDRVVMNPPFARGADVAHVEHALRFVRPGGRLVSVLPAGIRHRGGKAAARLLARVDRSGWFTSLPSGAFAESGTSIATVIAVIAVPGGPPAAEPARVTFDRTAGAPVFNPAAAGPGVYVHRETWGTGRDRVFRFTGNCLGCGAPTWRHDDGDDDVRGCFGDYTGMPVTRADLAATGAEARRGPASPGAQPAGTTRNGAPGRSAGPAPS
jgi:predicted RNA methylase